ncbi:uncharacterized protein N7503_001202 [Penicillium pulvis]|uniref:uncharacterized protein n=1 Tax=Penicillium pulvis TaxID=1562058 RepID=UPI00254906CB|nr:uncharacterized protein N7503_001202 [Penicillium pulvis]KAJ5814452.1 hypothetical protein N7503_001202 [Penicillium pulvis]
MGDEVPKTDKLATEAIKEETAIEGLDNIVLEVSNNNNDEALLKEIAKADNITIEKIAVDLVRDIAKGAARVWTNDAREGSSAGATLAAKKKFLKEISEADEDTMRTLIAATVKKLLEVAKKAAKIGVNTSKGPKGKARPKDLSNPTGPEGSGSGSVSEEVKEVEAQEKEKERAAYKNKDRAAKAKSDKKGKGKAKAVIDPSRSNSDDSA